MVVILRKLEVIKPFVIWTRKDWVKTRARKILVECHLISNQFLFNIATSSLLEWNNVVITLTDHLLFHVNIFQWNHHTTCISDLHIYTHFYTHWNVYNYYMIHIYNTAYFTKNVFMISRVWSGSGIVPGPAGPKLDRTGRGTKNVPAPVHSRHFCNVCTKILRKISLTTARCNKTHVNK